jgi:hypothetical protein
MEHTHTTGSIIEMLPEDIMVLILAFLPMDEMRNMGFVCKGFHKVLDSERIWSHLCEETFGLTYKLPTETWKNTYKQLSTHKVNCCPHLRWLDTKYLPRVFEKLTKHLAKQNSLLCYGSPEDEAKCHFSTKNLWMCVTPGCFYVGCGRRDGKHMLTHIKNTKHTLTLKLTSLELYCYSCRQWVGGEDKHEMEHLRYLEIREVLSRNTDVTYNQSIVERRVKERELPRLVQAMRYWVALSHEWEQKWERFIIGDDDGFCEKIDNSEITDSYIQRRGSYLMVSLLAWRYYVKQYGGGPLIVYDTADHTWLRDPANLEEMYQAAEEEWKKIKESQSQQVLPQWDETAANEAEAAEAEAEEEDEEGEDEDGDIMEVD